MDTENRQWFCDICEKKYSLKRKNKHLLTEVHKNNKERLYRNAIYEVYIMHRDELLEEYKMRRNERMMEGEDVGYMNFLGFLKKRIQDNKERKKLFGRNYKVTE